MSDLTDKIREAQIRAGEQVVIDDLRKRGLAEPAEDEWPTSLEAQVVRLQSALTTAHRERDLAGEQLLDRDRIIHGLNDEVRRLGLQRDAALAQVAVLAREFERICNAMTYGETDKAVIRARQALSSIDKRAEAICKVVEAAKELQAAKRYIKCEDAAYDIIGPGNSLASALALLGATNG